MVCMPFPELLELMYQALGFLRGRRPGVERILNWSGCRDGVCRVACTFAEQFQRHAVSNLKLPG
jgi:hypothetical protein